MGVVTEPDSLFLTSTAGGWKDFSRTLVPQKAAFTETPGFLNGLFKPQGLNATKNKAEPGSQPAQRLPGGGRTVVRASHPWPAPQGAQHSLSLV